MDNCIFCKIVKGEIPTSIEAETENLIAFNDIKPSADVHILIVPKLHINSYMQFTSDHKNLLFDMNIIAQKLINEKKLEGGYKIIFNGGKYQFVPHVHMHLLAGNMKKE